jgi:NADPH:quinone reductase-like Zn-dependent oxidoreductase
VYRALLTRGRLRAGESVLILGAGGGVATMALSVANAIGARAWVTSSTQDKIDRAIAAGAVDGVTYATDDWPAQAKRMSPGGRGFDVVLDSVGTWADSIAALRPGGRLVVLGASRAEQAQLAVRPFYFGQYELIGTTMGSARDFGGLLQLMATASVAPPVIDSVYPLDRAADAHTHLESGAAFGKIVLGIE